jgi:DNA-directed RNA polymerase specialized sigma24 family protein
MVHTQAVPDRPPFTDAERERAAELVERVRWFVVGRCRRLARIFGFDADDMAQMVLWEVSKRASVWDSTRCGPVLLAKFALRKVLDVHLSKRVRRAERGFVVGAGEDADGLPLCEYLTDALGSDPADDAGERELVERLPAALAELPAAERAAVESYYGLSGSRPVHDGIIGRQAGITRAGANARRQKALAKLAVLLRTPHKG